MKKIINKTLILMFIAVMVVTTMPLTGIDFTNIISPDAKAATKTETFTWGDYEYKIINTEEVEITSYSGNDTHITIPHQINGMLVTSIGEYSFTGGNIPTKSDWVAHPNQIFNKRIKSIVIPPSVKTIYAEAFSFIDSLENVVLNEGLELIDEFAFANCPKLTELKLPDSLVTFKLVAVDETPVEELIFGSNVKEFEVTTFVKNHVKKIVFNADVITFDKRIWLAPGTIDEIICNGRIELGSEFEIYGDSGVNKIICNGDVPYNVVTGMLKNGMVGYFDDLNSTVIFSEEEIFFPNEYESNGFRYFLNDESEAVISRYTGGESEVVVPETLDGHTVTQIGTFALSSFGGDFSDNHIPDTLITSIVLPETIEVLPDYAFSYNYNLKEINIPSKVKTIPYECFSYCISLEYVEIPETVTQIEGRAFNWCNNLKNINIPENITEICENTFRGCYALESVNMPGVKKIGEYAFCYCESLVIDELPKNLTEIGDGAFQRCESFECLDLSNVIKIGKSAMADCENLKEVILNDNLERLEYGVFQNCDSLERITLPSNLTYIGGYCFRLSGLKNIDFNDKLKEIAGGAFYGCFELTDVVLPDSLEYIRSLAFYRCHALETITIPTNVKILGYNSFARCANLTTVYFNAVNCKVIDRAGDEAYVPEDWTTASPFYATKITNIYFGEDITAISSNSETYGTFENCETLESVTIPASVEEIGTAAFKNCTNLETAIIPDSVTEIADDAFDGCDNLIIYCSETSYACTYALTQGIKVSTFIVEAIPNYTYTGNSIEPALSVSVSNVKLSENKDYTVAYSNNINVGEAKVKITGLGDYRNFASVASFTIVTRSITATKISNISAQNYTGKAVTPDITVVYNGKVLKEGTDYRLHYFNNKNVGEATIHVEGIGNFSGSDSIKFTIEKLSASEILMNRLRDFFNTIFIRFTTFFVK